MPELPEVETTVRAINKFENKRLLKVIIHNRNLRWKVDRIIEKKIDNKKVRSISRRAKYILIQFINLLTTLCGCIRIAVKSYCREVWALGQGL